MAAICMCLEGRPEILKESNQVERILKKAFRQTIRPSLKQTALRHLVELLKVSF